MQTDGDLPRSVSSDPAAWLFETFVAPTANSARLEGKSTKREPLTPELVQLHIWGLGERIGALPWLDADRVAWACCDIDGSAIAERAGALVHVKKGNPDALEGGHPRVLALLRAITDRFRANGIPHAVERSRSGNWHVWIVFSERLSAALVRRAILPVLRVAGLPDHADVLTPRGDTRGGPVGNGVYLPLYGNDTEGRTQFVELGPTGETSLPAPFEFPRCPRSAIEALAVQHGVAASAANGDDQGLVSSVRSTVERLRHECPRFRAAFDSCNEGRASEDDFAAACALAEHGVPEVDAARAIHFRRLTSAIGKERSPRDLERYAARTARSAYGTPREPCTHGFATVGPSEDSAFEAALVADTVEPWPTPLRSEAWHGLAGQFLELVGPESEADPAALLLQFLGAASCAIGREGASYVGATPHHARIWPLVVGSTSKARKGDSLTTALRPLALADRMVQRASGLSSGEGVLWAIRDAIRSVRADRRRGTSEEVETDQGVPDKRLLVAESEFGRALEAMRREGNTLSPILRELWDGLPEVRSLTKSSPARATAPHVVVIAHVTRPELLELLETNALTNGLANRFLFTAARRARELPFGGNIDDQRLMPLAQRLAGAIDQASKLARWHWDADAGEAWAAEYGALTAERPGLLGAATARAEAHVLRLALTYAMLDQSDRLVRLPHLRAALEVWRYCAESARWVFGEAFGGKGGEALRLIRGAGQFGIGRTELGRALYGQHYTAARLGRVLGDLLAAGQVRRETTATRGRPAERWIATNPFQPGGRRDPSSLRAESSGDKGDHGEKAGSRVKSDGSPSSPFPPLSPLMSAIETPGQSAESAWGSEPLRSSNDAPADSES